jgi:hypothetical protein
MNPEYVQAERKAALWLGWFHWSKQAEKWRAVADDRTRATSDRQDALRHLEKAWWAMRLCRARKRWWRGDEEDPDAPPPKEATLNEARAHENFVLEQEELK